MTRLRSIELECPRCGERQNTPIYDSINVSLDPILKEKLFRGEINLFRCEKCEENFFLQIPFLYHDMEKNILVQFYPFKFVEDKTFLEQFSKEGEFSFMVKGFLRRKKRRIFPTPHIVFDMGELIRYIIFRDNLYNLWSEAS